jgi:hypothetical protein
VDYDTADLLDELDNGDDGAPADLRAARTLLDELQRRQAIYQSHQGDLITGEAPGACTGKCKRPLGKRLFPTNPLSFV